MSSRSEKLKLQTFNFQKKIGPFIDFLIGFGYSSPGLIIRKISKSYYKNKFYLQNVMIVDSEFSLPDPNLKISTPQGGKINTALKAAGISDDTV